MVPPPDSGMHLARGEQVALEEVGAPRAREDSREGIAKDAGPAISRR